MKAIKFVNIKGKLSSKKFFSSSTIPLKSKIEKIYFFSS